MVLQVDMRNAFNSISRDAVLKGLPGQGTLGIQLAPVLLLWNTQEHATQKWWAEKVSTSRASGSTTSGRLGTA